MKTVISIETGLKLYDVSDDNFVAPEGQQVVSFISSEKEEIIEVPEEITALQFFSQLLIEGITETAIRETVDYLVSEEQLTPTQGEIAKIALRKATVFERSHSFILLIGLAFSKTETELDAIFINASKL